MGYTHYMRQQRPATQEEWDALTDTFNKLMAKGNLPIQREEDDASPPLVSGDQIIFNGIGDDAHETMVLEREGGGFSFCKTARKPYDRAVVCLLIIANHVAPGVWVIESDGTPAEWEPDLEWLNQQGLGTFSLPIGVKE